MALIKNLDQDMLEKRVEKIHMKHLKGMNCAEKVFSTLYSVIDTNIPSDVVSLLSGFGGGIGGTRDGVCGAISGGVAAIGLIYGRKKPPEGNRERVSEISRDFLTQFKSRFGSIICHELVGDLLLDNNPECERRRAERCSQFTLNAAKICVNILKRYEKIYAIE
jgi:C_GCAxxG_C_C family probable redox protein